MWYRRPPPSFFSITLSDNGARASWVKRERAKRDVYAEVSILEWQNGTGTSCLRPIHDLGGTATRREKGGKIHTSSLEIHPLGHWGETGHQSGLLIFPRPSRGEPREGMSLVGCSGGEGKYKRNKLPFQDVFSRPLMQQYSIKTMKRPVRFGRRRLWTTKIRSIMIPPHVPCMTYLAYLVSAATTMPVC
ncbi:hypothetical protein F4821DRAFT_85805 [Hypoxylon rubiginosum]|uniref:Uncharacterized protein n=1 Tax=Hypoxylon rubiginosum TaxID=110542 RepID=A0ACC0D7B1_9PEZI|nr:hypothetical protein F4821DRAFT_85805 [Hypoxylon rubiginosum]